MNVKRLLVLALMIVLVVGVESQAQQARQETPAPQPAKELDYAETTDFKGRLFEVKHQDPAAIVGVVRVLGSGFKGSTMTFSRELGTITVRDFPENLALIEQAIKRLDVPQPKRAEVELRMDIMLASASEGARDDFPPALGDVVKQLRGVFSYKGYQLVGSVLQRARDRSGINSSGSVKVDLPGRDEASFARYTWVIRELAVNCGEQGRCAVSMDRLILRFEGVGAVGSGTIGTDLTIKAGEKIVVGTTTLVVGPQQPAAETRALVLVLTAKVLE